MTGSCRRQSPITGLENPNSIAQLSTWLEKETDTAVTDLRKDTVAAPCWKAKL